MRNRVLLKMINNLVPKNKSYIYAVPHPNGKADKYDMINYSSDNLLCVLNRLMTDSEISFKGKIFVEIYDSNRKKSLEEYCSKSKNIKFVFLESCILDKLSVQNIFIKLRNTFCRFRCSIWLSDTGYCEYYEKTSRQKYFCMNYSTPFKQAERIDDKYNFAYLNGHLETSLMTSMVHSAIFRLRQPNCWIDGFPRNDNLWYSSKKEDVLSWVKRQTNCEFRKIIVFAPTYRPNNDNEDYATNLFGFSIEGLNKFLEDEKLIVIVKMHPMQKIDSSVYTNRIIKYETTYDFSLYDVLAVSDVLISDYSSVIHDYVLTGKCVVQVLTDYQNYCDSRGLVFEPIDYVCPAICIFNKDEFIEKMRSAINYKKDAKYDCVVSIFHRYKDFDSTDRVTKHLVSEISNL